MANTLKRLELNKPEFNTRAMNFFNLMNVKDFQEKFFENPVSVSAKEFGLKIPTNATVSNVNKSIFKLLSDPNFNAWAKDFQQSIESSFPNLSSSEKMTDILKIAQMKANQEKFKEEFAQSVVQHLNPNSYKDILVNGKLKPGVINSEGDVAVVLLTFVVVVVVLAVAAGIAKPSDSLSRINVSLLVNQLDKQHQQALQNNIR